MEYAGEKEYDIIPECHGNAKSTHPAKFVCQYMTGPERDRAMRGEYMLDSFGKHVARLATDKEYAFKVSVLRIENVVYAGEQVNDAQSFLALRDPKIDDMFDEVASEIMKRNQRRNTKN